VRTQVLAVCAFKLIILLDVYTITIKRRLDKPFLLSFNGKMLNAFVKVNVANNMTFVASCYYSLIKLD
jgi:hypothetical protein